jgi:hypothetical protein
MPNITDSPNRQVSRMGSGGMLGQNSLANLPHATRYMASRLYKPIKSYKAQVAQMEDGGSIHIKASHKGRFTAYKERTGKTTEEAMHSSDPHVRQMANFAHNAAGWDKKAHGGNIADGALKPRKAHGQPRLQGKHPVPSAAQPAQPQIPQGIPQGVPPQMPQGLQPAQMQQMQQMMQQGNGLRPQANGGQIQPMSSQDAKFNGPSHANGGIKIPSHGVEVEGGETANKGFVFSKKLGYAQKHEKIAKALGKAEQRPPSAINQATTNALQRKTELLKQQQEAHKASLGMPNDLQQQKMADGGFIGGGGGGGKPGDPPAKKVDPRVAQLMAANYNPSILTNGKFMVEKADGSIGQWGNPVTQGTDQVNPVTVPPIQLSDKAVGKASYYTPARNVQTSPAVATIKSPSFKFGGKMRRMDDGGITDGPPPKKKPLNGVGTMPALNNGLTPLTGTPDLSFIPRDTSLDGNSIMKYIASQKPVVKQAPIVANAAGAQVKTRPAGKPVTTYQRPGPIDDINAPKPVFDTPELTTANFTFPQSPQVAGASTTQAPVQTSSNSKSGFSQAVDKVSPFLSNFMNATQRLPLPPNPVLNTEITPNLVNYDASRAEAVRQTRGADKVARENLNSGAAVSATKAANLAQQDRAIGQANEAESNTNAGIRNQAAAENAQIRAGNNALTNNYNNEMVSRQLKGQQLNTQNMANIEEKINGLARDKKLFNLEDQKLMLEALKDNTGASYRAARSVFQRNLSPESMAEIEANYAKVQKYQDEDRAEGRRAGIFGSYLKGRGVDPTKLTPEQNQAEYNAWVLGAGAGSQIEPAKGERFGETDVTSSGPKGTTTKKTTKR